VRRFPAIALILGWGILAHAQTGPIGPPAASYCSAANEVLYCAGAGDLQTLDIGTSAGDLIVLDGSARLPAVDGSQLTNLPSSGGGLPAFEVCAGCDYTTIQTAITAAEAAGGGVVQVAPGSYTEALEAAAGVHMICQVPSAQVKACRVTGTSGNPAITYDIGTPGGSRESHVSMAEGFLFVSGGGTGTPAVSVECPTPAAQRVELYEIDAFSAAGSGRAISMTCGATGSGGLSTLARLHGEMIQLASQGGSTESVVYHSGGWLDVRGYAAIDAASGDDVALEVASAGAGTVSFADFLITGAVEVGAASTTVVTLSQGIVSTATVSPVNTNGSGALSMVVVGLWAVASAPTACVTGAGVVAHSPSSLSNVGNCGTLIASTVNGGLGPNVAAIPSRYQQTVAPATFLDESSNLSDLDSASTARINLGLGSAATQDVGTSAGNVVELDSSGRLPAVDGSQLLNLPGGGSGASTGRVGAYRNAALSLGAGNTDLVFDVERYDSGSDYDSTTGIFTAPSSGVYCIDAVITMQANEYLVMVLWRDTGSGMAEYLRGQYDDGFHGADFAACPYLDAGDAVKLVGRIPTGSGSLDVSADTLNWLTIVGPLGSGGNHAGH